MKRISAALTEYFPGDDRSVVARAYWDGSVGVYTLIRVGDSVPQAVIGKQIAPAVRAAMDLERALGGYGDVHFTVLVDPRAIRAQPTEPAFGYVKIARGPVPLESVPDHLDSISRELERATGERALED